MKNIKKLASSGSARLSKMINTDVNYATKGLAIFSSQHTITTLLAFLFAVTTARLFPKETIGLYKYIISFAAFITLFQLNGTASTLSRAIVQGYDGTLKKLLQINFRWNIGIAIILFATSAYYAFLATPHNPFLALPLFISALLLPLSETTDLIFAYLNGKKLFKISASFQVIRSFVEYVAVLVVGIATYSAYYMGTAYFIVHCLLTLAVFLYVMQENPPANSTVDPHAKRLTTHNSVVSILGGVADQIDNLLVFHFVGAAGLAIYAFADAIPSAINGYFKQISIIVLPKYAKTRTRDFRDMVQKSAVIASFILAVSITYFFAAPFIYKILFPHFTDSIKYSQIIMFMFVFSPILFSTYIDSQSSIRARYLSNIPVSIFKITATVIGAAFWGIWGVIFARLLSKMVILFTVSYIAHRLNVEAHTELTPHL